MNSLKEAPNVELPSSEDEEDAVTVVDYDVYDAQTQETTFPAKFKITSESATSLKKDYILSLCRDSAFTRVVAGLTDATIQLFDISNAQALVRTAVGLPRVAATNKEPKVIGVRFLDETPNLLLVGSSTGEVDLYDLRTPQKSQACFKGVPECLGEFGANDKVAAACCKSIASFDSNANARIICTGTEQCQGGAMLFFYDVRERIPLGAYTDSHQDEVTSLRFHERNPDLLCSGSTDGLINIFDIRENDEIDALQTTINTESSVHKLNWHKNVYDKDIISCITHTDDFKAYECEEGDLVTEFQRIAITKAMCRKSPENCNVIGAHNTGDGGFFLLSGTNSNKGEVLRSLLLQNKNLLPLADFSGNKQIVRESLYDAKSNSLITGGECGVVTLWQQTGEQPSESISSSLKIKTKSKKKAAKPY